MSESSECEKLFQKLKDIIDMFDEMMESIPVDDRYDEFAQESGEMSAQLRKFLRSVKQVAHDIEHDV